MEKLAIDVLIFCFLVLAFTFNIYANKKLDKKIEKHIRTKRHGGVS